MEISELRFKCIYCGRGFILKNSELTINEYKCANCNHLYQIKNNIPILTKKSKYYGELQRPDMVRLIEDLDSCDWKKVVFERCARLSEFFYQIIMDETRADFQYLFSLNKNSLVIDIGSGWGTISIPIAKRAQVIAVDNTFERLHFLKKRCLQDKINDISLMCADTTELPFRDDQFDLAVLNGVLEWVGFFRRDKNPYKLQLQVLKQIYAILKPQGKLYLGIENSHSARYLCGIPDDHTGLKHISYLSRLKANWLMLKKKGKPYRTYTYNKDGYTELLQKAGFKKIEFFYPAPMYKMFSYIMPLDKLQIAKFYYEYLQPDFAQDTTEQRIRRLEKEALDNGTFADKIASYAIIAEKSDG